jgi:RNA polymerase-interacting CarD/CdnL/TRCF family regulator
VFKVGDDVVHPAHGVGQIVKLGEMQFVEAEARMYFEIATHRGTVWVPVDAYAACGLRLLTDKGDLSRYRDVLKSRPAVLDKDHRKRQFDLAEQLKRGSFQILCEVVRDLSARGWRRPLSEADSAALRKARDRLCQEWAASQGVSIAEATQEIESLLFEARQAFAA